MRDNQELYKVFGAAGLANTHDVKRTSEFRSRANGRYIYLNKDLLPNNRICVLIEDSLPDSNVNGTRTLGIRFRSNLTQFPTKINNGKTPCHYGRAIEAENSGSLRDFLVWFSGLS